jgi:hypothetical protein
MHPNDAARVLATAAVYDKRTPSRAEAFTWAADLGDMSVDEAIAAVGEHFRNRPDVYLNVGHVIEIVKRHRRSGLDQSSRLENAAILALDPDDPEYNRKYLNAIREARETAAVDGSAVPERPGLPSRFEAGEETAQRARRGAELCRAALAEHTGPSPSLDDTDDGLTDPVRRARARAAEERRKRRRGDPSPIGETLHHIQRPTTGDTQ